MDKFGGGFWFETNTLKCTIGGLFGALAYCAAIDMLQPEDSARLVDYEAHRGDLGMRIEAKGLNFTYGGCDAPTLHNISLTVEPGTTLAIVG
jgi:ABC-type multidrug transport system fused ATPase/permease subunit